MNFRWRDILETAIVLTALGLLGATIHLAWCVGGTVGGLPCR
jgi:hypothetical protein